MNQYRRLIGAALVQMTVQLHAYVARPELPTSHGMIIGSLAFFAVIALFPKEPA